MTIELVKILEEALKHYENEMREWDYCQKAEEENDFEMAHIYWSNSQFESGKVEGLLMAYEFATGKKLYGWQIKDELFAIA